MTQKRFTKYVPDSYGYTYITTIIDNEKNKQTGNIDEIVDLLNELDEKYVDEFSLRETLQQELQRSEEENKQLKKILNELSDMLQFDVENGIRSYPVKLSEYLSNALKELKE